MKAIKFVKAESDADGLPRYEVRVGANVIGHVGRYRSGWTRKAAGRRYSTASGQHDRLWYFQPAGSDHRQKYHDSRDHAAVELIARALNVPVHRVREAVKAVESAKT